MTNVLRMLFGADGVVFTLVGAIVLVLPSARAAALPPEAGATPHVVDTRRLLASAYVGVGLFLLSCASGAADEHYLRHAAVLRAVSLLVLVGCNAIQVRNGNWKPATLAPYLFAFPAMAVAYLWLGLA